MFDWRAKADYAGLPVLDSLLQPLHNARAAGLSAERRPSNDEILTAKPNRRGKTSKPLPRAFASSFFTAVQSVGYFETARVDEINRTGGGGEDLYSGNFHWSVSLLNLPGRAGHDLNLTLSYNSHFPEIESGLFQFLPCLVVDF